MSKDGFEVEIDLFESEGWSVELFEANLPHSACFFQIFMQEGFAVAAIRRDQAHLLSRAGLAYEVHDLLDFLLVDRLEYRE